MININRTITDAIRDHRFTDAATTLRALNPHTTRDDRAATMTRLISIYH